MARDAENGLPVELGIEQLSSDQDERLRSVGKMVYKVTKGLEAIKTTRELIAADKSELARFEREPIVPSPRNFFAVIIDDIEAVKVQSARFVDKGCRSGYVLDTIEQTAVENNGKDRAPLVFFSTSYRPYSIEVYHDYLFHGFEFKGPGHSGYDMDVGFDRQSGAPAGVRLHEIPHHKALRLINEGLVALPLPEENQFNSYLEGMHYEIEREPAAADASESVAIISEN